MMQYTHLSPQEEVRCMCASFYVVAEGILEYEGRPVLYLIEGTTPLTCCGGDSGGVPFIAVPGFVKAWRSGTSEVGSPVSEIEPVVGEETRTEIKRILALEHGISNIDFW